MLKAMSMPSTIIIFCVVDLLLLRFFCFLLAINLAHSSIRPVEQSVRLLTQFQKLKHTY
jgi:hypothetical protein